MSNENAWINNIDWIYPIFMDLVALRVTTLSAAKSTLQTLEDYQYFLALTGLTSSLFSSPASQAEVFESHIPSLPSYSTRLKLARSPHEFFPPLSHFSIIKPQNHPPIHIQTPATQKHHPFKMGHLLEYGLVPWHIAR